MKKSDIIDIQVPGDKSVTHRSLMFAALASGKSRVRRPLDSADTRSTARVLRALHARVPMLAEEISIEGVGLHGLQAAHDTLDCGNSGTTVRLMMGIAAGYAFPSRFDGDASLRSRPMRRVTDPLAQMGVQVRELGEVDRLPLEIVGGKLRPLDFVNSKSSGQVKSAVLLAALLGGTTAKVFEPVHSRDHTERMLGGMGAHVRTMADTDGMHIEIAPAERLEPIDILVPGDFSSSAFFLVRGLLGGAAVRIRDVGVNATRTGLLNVLRRMNATVHVEERHESGNEPTATFVAEAGELHGTHVEAGEIPHMVDEVPILAILASQSHGTTVITGAGELRVKETDRLRAIAENLRAVGARAEETQDGLIIEGCDARLRGRVRTYGDHRIAMAFGVLGSLPGNEIVMDDVACVAVSFPGFWEQLGKLVR